MNTNCQQDQNKNKNLTKQNFFKIVITFLTNFVNCKCNNLIIDSKEKSHSFHRYLLSLAVLYYGNALGLILIAANLN